MAQAGSTGRFRVGSLLLANSVEVFTGSAAPTNGVSGTGAGKAGPGSFYIRTNGAVFTNTGTKASPTWTQLGTTAALTSAHIFVGSAGGAATDVAVTGDVTISNAGVTAIGAKKVLETMVAIADGKILVGGAGGAAAAQTMSGDAALSNAGVLSLASHAVKYAEFTILAADIIATGAGKFGHANGVEVLAGQGAGTVIELLSVCLIYDQGVKAYQGGGATTIHYTGGSAISNSLIESEFCAHNGDTVNQIVALDTANGIPMLVNTGLSLVTAAAFTDAGVGAVGVIRGKVAYRVHATGL